jgi:hypothetical protein
MRQEKATYWRGYPLDALSPRGHPAASGEARLRLMGRARVRGGALPMPFGWIRKIKERRKWERCMQDLAAKGMLIDEEELAEAMERAATMLQVRVCSWATMTRTLGPAELEATDSGYTLRVSDLIVSADGRSIRGGEVLTEVALLYAAISETAKSKGILDYVIKPGKGAAVCDHTDVGPIESHPLDSLQSSLEDIAAILLCHR